VFYINGSETLPPPLSKQEEAEVLQRIAEGDESAREPLIVHNLRLVVYIAKKFESPGAGTEDLISIGTIGLIKAVNTFSPEKNIKLATYASRCIENEILMYLRRVAKLKSEVSFDEPLNTDFEGNELLLSDVLGTSADTVYGDIENNVEKQLLKDALKKQRKKKKSKTKKKEKSKDSKQVILYIGKEKSPDTK
jgi:RNA polymerase sporulation-specific sigma factor